VIELPRVLGWTAAAIATVALALLLPYRLTDGDSCLYAAMAHDIARGGAWAAPTWDFHGVAAPFHEHPPGAFWLSALVERLGAPPANAALVANALWTFAAVAGVIALARLFVERSTAQFAGLAFLLHIAVLRYVQRASLEIPLAATAAWTLAAGLRLGRGRVWIAATAASLAGAFLVRGIFGAVPAALLVLALLDRDLRPPPLRLALAFAGAAAALVAFDRAHAAATGHGFWAAYVERQVAPSLSGTSTHSVAGETWTYYVGRAVLYTLPWSLLPLVRFVRGRRRVPAPAAWRLSIAWIALTVVGASLTSREGSRYLFQMYVATALLAALALGPSLRPDLAWIASTLVLLVPASTVLLKSSFHGRDEWWRTAELCATHRGDASLAGRTVRGLFQPEDDRLKSLLRFHLGLWVSSERPTDMTGLQWVPSAGADFPVGRVVVATPLGALVDFDR
jgi:4-amino-4-deoxy-L-arabinose transferase-like glycosyltransferase